MKIEGIFPDNLMFVPLSYTEPAGVITTYPIIHFVAPPPTTPPTPFEFLTIAHELGHALHFSLVPYWQRVQAEAQQDSRRITHDITAAEAATGQ